MRSGYGGNSNSSYVLVYLDKLLQLIIKNKMFQDYYVEGKDRTDIVNEVFDLSIYSKIEIESMFDELIDSPLETNFTVIGYFKLKEIYDKFIASNPSSKNNFYDILLNGAYLNLNLTTNKLIDFYE